MPFGKYEDYTIAPSFNDGIATVATPLAKTVLSS